jgi:hypothetical protein
MTQFSLFFQVSLQSSALQFFEVDAHVVLKITRIHRRSHTGMRKKDVATLPTRLELLVFCPLRDISLCRFTSHMCKNVFHCRSNLTDPIFF